MLTDSVMCKFNFGKARSQQTRLSLSQQQKKTIEFTLKQYDETKESNVKDEE